MPENMPVNMIDLIAALPGLRWKARVVLTHEFAQQKEWAARLAGITGAGHIDLLEAFHQDQALSSRISAFTATGLFDYLSKQGGRHPVLIVSGMEFLKASWSARPDMLEQFGSQVQGWARLPALLIALQYDKVLANQRRASRYGDTQFVIDQRETLAL